MSKRPLSITIIGWLYIAVGALGFGFHLSDFKTEHGFQSDVIWVELLRILAIVAGVYMLRGRNWARWLALAWITFHVVVGALHSWVQFGMHAALCAIFAYILFRPAAGRYFRQGA